MKPRISITIDEADLAVIDRYAAASGTPRASMLASMVRATVPELERAAELIELANAAPRKVVQGLVEDLANATADAMGYLEPFHSDYRKVMDKLQGELPLHKPKRRPAGDALARDVGRSRSAGGSGKKRALDPHLLTGGSK